MPALPTPQPPATRRSFVLAALLAVVLALSVDARTLVEQWLAPAAPDLPDRGAAQQAIDAAWQLGVPGPQRPRATARLAIDRLEASTPAAGAATRFAAQTRGGLLPRYRWDFGDGSPATEWSILHSAEHRYAQAGTYAVRVTVVDDRGQRQERVLMHSTDDAADTVAAAAPR